jgi:hypothetical protein
MLSLGLKKGKVTLMVSIKKPACVLAAFTLFFLGLTARSLVEAKGTNDLKNIATSHTMDVTVDTASECPGEDLIAVRPVLNSVS